MPQLHLLPEDLNLEELLLKIQTPKPPDRPATVMQVQVGLTGRPPATVFHQAWRGIQMDYASTFAEEVVTAFLYGEKPSDVGKAAVGVHKLARVHERRFQF